MVGRKKKAKICDKVSHEEEDRISQLPEPLISEILCHLSTEDAVRTSVLSTKWRNLWRRVSDLDLDSYAFSNFDSFVSFVERFFDSHKESWIRKLRLSIIYYSQDKSFLTRWIDAVTTRRIQHLDVDCRGGYEIPQSIYTCETLVHLRLCWADLADAEFVSLPCLKIMHLENIRCPSEFTLQLQKLISGSPVLEDLKLLGCSYHKAIQVRSNTLKRIDIDDTQVVIDTPLLQCLRTKIYVTKNFQIISSGFPAKLDIDFLYTGVRSCKNVIRDIITNITRVRDLAITSNTWKKILLYTKSRPVRYFRHLSYLNARFYISDLDILPILLESCKKLESLILETVKDPSMRNKRKREPNVTFSTVPQCLVSSLKFVEMKRSISGYEGEMELVRYLLKNSKILEKLRLDVYYTKKAMCDFFKELVAIPRCSSACEVIVL